MIELNSLGRFSPVEFRSEMEIAICASNDGPSLDQLFLGAGKAKNILKQIFEIFGLLRLFYSLTRIRFDSLKKSPDSFIFYFRKRICK